ncbi:helix-turn-helix transcriptional regulator [Nocardia otitidiscaviarum]|uniref:helix-turn-helix domain-containing protein n=1 Tax=Nocardia otitidiscaviarum TaxID=1823 RepID=UPI001894EF79|nr:helix-turn-helix transcriptional regulator [Nocardia otitidiscaviarum]MBF6236289.1 helix-turn-helix transcriptional regulator [Nocardia otitidiscaviarum]
MAAQPTGVGARIAQARKLRGWSQDRLAMEADISPSLVRKVEQGRRAATSAFVASCARVLRTSAAELLGQPFPQTSSADREVHAAIAIIRNELAAYDIDVPDMQTRPIPVLAGHIAEVRRYRRAAAAPKLAAVLPPLLAEVRASVHRAAGNTRDQTLNLLCELYYSSHSLAHKLGYTDLAAIAIDRMSWAAEESGDPLWNATSRFHRAALLTAGGDWNAALTFLERCRADIEPRLAVGVEHDLIAWGGLHLQSGLAAARSGARVLSDAHLSEARETAARIGADRDPILSFGPTNVGIWNVAMAVEMMDGTEALARADTLVLPSSTPRERSGHHYIDLARAWLLHGKRASALGALQTARKLAPSQTRYHPMVHETVRVLAHEEARSTESLRGFAAWCGIT